MPRGRPRLVPKEPPSQSENIIAKILADNCGIKGCGSTWHLDGARDIVTALGQADFRIIKER